MLKAEDMVLKWSFEMQLCYDFSEIDSKIVQFLNVSDI